MANFERLLAPGATEMPDCICGTAMRFDHSERNLQSPDSEVRVYACAACGHEFRLMVWTDADGGSSVPARKPGTLAL